MSLLQECSNDIVVDARLNDFILSLFQPCLLLIYLNSVWKDGELVLPRLCIPLKAETPVANFLCAKGIWMDDSWVAKLPVSMPWSQTSPVLFSTGMPTSVV